MKNRKSMSVSGQSMQDRETTNKKIRFHEGFIRECGCGIIHELLYLCNYHKELFKSSYTVND